MTKTEQVKEIFSKLEDDVSDISEDAAIFVSQAEEKILAIVALLETKIELMPVILKKACEMDNVLLTNTVVEASNKNMKIINCTPHTVSILDARCIRYNLIHKSFDLVGTRVILHEFSPSGIIPRCSTKDKIKGNFNGIPIVRLEFGEIEGLPPEEENTMLIVSAIVAKVGRSQGRKDLLVPTRMVRDSEGRICGCLALAI